MSFVGVITIHCSLLLPLSEILRVLLYRLGIDDGNAWRVFVPDGTTNYAREVIDSLAVGARECCFIFALALFRKIIALGGCIATVLI